MHARWMAALAKTTHLTSKTLDFAKRILIIKGMVAGSVAALALFGIAVPYLGPLLHIQPHPTAFNGGIVAAAGAIFGAIAAARA